MPTPHYLLHEAGAPIETALVDEQNAPPQGAFYAFSDKALYDRFLLNNQRDLRPYPLVRGFVLRRIAMKKETTLFMAIDAEAPDQKLLDVATLEAVLDALDHQSPFVFTLPREAQSGHRADTILPLATTQANRMPNVV